MLGAVTILGAPDTAPARTAAGATRCTREPRRDPIDQRGEPLGPAVNPYAVSRGHRGRVDVPPAAPGPRGGPEQSTQITNYHNRDSSAAAGGGRLSRCAGRF